MKNKLVKYFTILVICMLFFPIVGSKLILKYKFPLKSNDLAGLEELTAKVFTFTNQNDYQKMDHTRLIHGVNLWPFHQFDNIWFDHVIFIYQTAMNYFKLDGYLCGGHSRYLLRLFEKHGIKSFTYNHGINGTRFTHVNVVAEYKNNLYIFDPTYNFVYQDKEKYLTFRDVINLVPQKKNFEKYIKIINPQDKIYSLKKKKYENFTPSQIVRDFNEGSFLMSKDKNHLLLNGYDVYAGTGKKEYFFKKYTYLKSITKQ